MCAINVCHLVQICSGVSKTAVQGLTKALAKELAPKTRCNVIAPGMIKTAFSKPLWDPAVEGGAEMEAELSERSYLNRLGEAHEIAGIAAFLLSNDAAFVTGESIVANGGGDGARL